MRKFLKTLPMKLYLLLLAAVLFSFFSNDFGLVDIQKTAIILAAGVDKTENGFLLTAQIAVPKGSDRTTGGTSSVEIEAEGKTVSDCVTSIYSKTGWVPKLVFCDLIVLGEETAKSDVISHLNYFLRNEYMPDSCLVAVCEGSAKELLSSTSALADASSLAIEQLFSDAAQKSGKVMPNTLKEFAIGYYGVSKSSYLPFLRMADQEGAENAASGSSSGGEGTEPQKIYTAEETAIFSEGRMVGLLSPEETLLFSMLEGKVFAGTLSAEREGEPVTLTVLKNDGSVSLKGEDAPKAVLSVSLVVRLCCRGVTAPIADVSDDSVPKEVLESAASALKEHAAALFEHAKSAGCDLFNLKRTLYRTSPKRYAKWKDLLPGAAEVALDVSVSSKK